MIMYAKSGSAIHIGRAGEHFATDVVFDIENWIKEYGVGTATLVVQQNGATYPQLTTQTANTVVWTVTKSNTHTAGGGQCELFYAKRNADGEDIIVKSAIYDIIVTNALGDGEDEPPAAYESWVDEIAEKADYIIGNIGATEEASQKAIESAAAAKVSETNSKTSETGAISAKNDAITAKTAAETARTGAESARDLAVTAKNEATTAKTAAQTAQALSESARDGSITAKNQSITAKTAAETSEVNAKTSETNAKDSENESKLSETNAKASEVNAKSSENAAALSETNAKVSEDAAKDSEEAAFDSALLSESWAVGDTGIRIDEDVNNSKYWAERAAEIVTEGGVASFNDRIGYVYPEAGDYTPEMVGADPEGLAEQLVSEHNISEDAHEELFSKKSEIAIGFNITLTPTNWVEEFQPNGSLKYYQNNSNTQFKADGFSYFITPIKASLEDYLDASIAADDITQDGVAKFYADYIPASILTAKVLCIQAVDE